MANNIFRSALIRSILVNNIQQNIKHLDNVGCSFTKMDHLAILRQFTSSTSLNQSFDNEALSKLVKSDKVVVFMKGVPEEPRCGFSNAVVQVLRMHGVPFQAHNVLSSDELRKAIKDFTSWPTIPQIFIDGEFIGGCDILLEKHQNGELVEDLRKVGIKSQLLENKE